MNKFLSSHSLIAATLRVARPPVRAIIPLLICLTPTFLLFSCGPEHRDTPYTEPLSTTDPQIARGQLVYMRFCHQCHPSGAAALGPALNDKPLPLWAMRYQVRHGLGAMPAFSKDQLPDPDLDALLAYQKSLRSLK